MNVTVDVQGVMIPRLGLGTYQLKGDDCREVVGAALDIGYRHVDTAEAYENEAEIGRTLEDSRIPRDELFLTTKVWWTHLKGTELRRHLDASLERLRSDYVDLTLIHWPNTDLSLGEPLEAMQELKEAGRTRLIGVSNFTPELLERAAELTPIATNQVEYHPFLAQDDLRNLARRLGHVLTAYCPIARNRVADDPVIQQIAERHERTPAQVTLRWHLQQQEVIAVPRSSKRTHLEQNFDVFDFELTDGEMESIHQRARGERIVDPEWAPTW